MEKKIFCVVPAFNEEKNISRVIKIVKPLVDQVVVVDDCSRDKTYALAAAEGVVVLRHIINRGQGAALQTGNDYAIKMGADIIVHFDADGQFSADEIGDLVNPIVNGEFDVVFGSRFLGKKSDMPWMKEKFIMPIARLVNAILLDVRITDPQAGFRALSRKAAMSFRIMNDGHAHCSEIMHKTIKNRLKFREVPITVTYHHFGQTVFSGKGRRSGGLTIIKDLLLAKFID